MCDSSGRLRLVETPRKPQQGNWVSRTQLTWGGGNALAQLALTWVLRHTTMTSVLIGASKVAQIEDAVDTLNNPSLSDEELQTIETILKGD